jgi:plasmid stabilization system protein ParE
VPGAWDITRRVLAENGGPINFTVVWTRPALNQLADLWTQATDRAAVTAASDRVDATLAADAANAGDSRGGAVRLLFDRPLAILFRVDEETDRVYVVSVSTARRR